MFGARWQTSSVSSEPVRFLALGDSYTTCTGASGVDQSWPEIVARRLAERIGRQVDVTNPAVNGFTTLDLIDRELAFIKRLEPGLVTVLIGVNDLVRGRETDQYRASLVTIYDEVATLELPLGRALAISIPNWSVVPAAREYGDPEEIRHLTDTFNDIAKEEAEARRFKWVDVTAASISGLGTADWISSDRLHPGDRQYAAWAEVIWHGIRQGWE